MALIELPSGDFIDPTIVRGVRPMIGDKMGPRVLVDVITRTEVIMVEFDLPEAAREWAREFAGKVNAALETSSK